MVFGEVVHFAALREVLAEDGLPDARKVDALARLGPQRVVTPGRAVALDRITYDEWNDGRRSR